jgi:hypothetical protein
VRNWKGPKSIRRYLDNEIFPTLGERALKDVNALDVQQHHQNLAQGAFTNALGHRTQLEGMKNGCRVVLNPP